MEYYRTLALVARVTGDLRDGTATGEVFSWRTQRWERDDDVALEILTKGDWQPISEAAADEFIESRQADRRPVGARSVRTA